MAVIVQVHNRKTNTLHRMYSVDARELCQRDRDCVPVSEEGAAVLRAKPQKLSTKATPPAGAPFDDPNAAGRGGDLSQPQPAVVETSVPLAPANEPARVATEALPEKSVVEQLPEPAPVAAVLATEPIAVTEAEAAPLAVQVDEAETKTDLVSDHLS